MGFSAAKEKQKSYNRFLSLHYMPFFEQVTPYAIQVTIDCAITTADEETSFLSWFRIHSEEIPGLVRKERD